MDELNYCYECTGYGDDYYVDDDGELVCRCPECPFNPFRDDDWDDQKGADMQELDKAIKILKEQYEKAQHMDWVRNKIAYALYQTWKIFDER